jgi:GMP synthase (glutamine-hydrolysing)
MTTEVAALDKGFNPSEFIRSKIQEIGGITQKNKVLLACSGGLCSNVMVALLRKAVEKPNFVSFLIDTGFMREKEIDSVSETLSRAPMKLELEVFDARKRFLRAMEHAETGEDKRKVFDETFETTLKELADEKEADLIAVGASATSVVGHGMEFVSSTQSPRHSIAYITPLISLNRTQVAQVAQTLELPPRLSDLVPYPSMGLSIRALGKITDEKIKLAREANRIIEEELQYIRPTQYLAAILDNKEEKNEKIDRMREKISDLFDVGSDQVDVVIPQCGFSALADHKRVYMKGVAIRVTLLGSKELLESDNGDLSIFPAEFMSRFKEVGRCLYSITTKPRNGKYIAVVRAVSTGNFNEANMARLEWSKLHSIAERIMKECGKVSSVYYDTTPKPPATIEFE